MKKRIKYAIAAIIIVASLTGTGIYQAITVFTLSTQTANVPPIPGASINASVGGNTVNYSLKSAIFYPGPFWINLTDYARNYHEILGIMQFTLTKYYQRLAFPYTDTSMLPGNVSIVLSNATTGLSETFSSATVTSNPFAAAQSLKYNIIINPRPSGIAVIFKPPPEKLPILGTTARLTINMNITLFGDIGPFHFFGKTIDMKQSGFLGFYSN